MRKVFALLVVGAALTAFGCAENDTTAPPANNEAAPAGDTPADDTMTPAEESASDTP